MTTSTRRRTRSIALSGAFLALAAGGTAACDGAPETVEETHRGAPETVEETHRFYCTTEDGKVVDEDHCDDDGDGLGGMFFIYHSTSYPADLRPGAKVPAGGQRFAYNDKAARTNWGLPPSGRISNGTTTKVGVLGKGGPPAAGSKAGG